MLLGSFSPSCLAIFASHWVFAVVFTLAFALSLNMRSPSLALGLLSPTPRHHWHGNERLWFIMLGMTSFSLLIAARDILRSNLYPVWPKKKVCVMIARLTSDAIPAGSAPLPSGVLWQ